MLFEDHKNSGDIEVERVGDDVVVTVCDEWTCKSYSLSPDALGKLRRALREDLEEQIARDNDALKHIRRIDIRVETADDVLNVTRSYSVHDGAPIGAYIHYLLAQAYSMTLDALRKKGIIPRGEVRSALDIEQERDRQQLEPSSPPSVATGHLR